MRLLPAHDVLYDACKVLPSSSNTDVVGVLSRPLLFLHAGEEKRLAPGALIVDVSCDLAMGFPFARPTSFERQTLLMFLARTADDAKGKHERLLSSHLHVALVCETKVHTIAM